MVDVTYGDWAYLCDDLFKSLWHISPWIRWIRSPLTVSDPKQWLCQVLPFPLLDLDLWGHGLSHWALHMLDLLLHALLTISLRLNLQLPPFLHQPQIKGALKDSSPSSLAHPFLGPPWMWRSRIYEKKRGGWKLSLAKCKSPLPPNAGLFHSHSCPHSLYQWELCRTEGTFHEILALSRTPSDSPWASV